MSSEPPIYETVDDACPRCLARDQHDVFCDVCALRLRPGLRSAQPRADERAAQWEAANPEWEADWRRETGQQGDDFPQSASPPGGHPAPTAAVTPPPGPLGSASPPQRTVVHATPDGHRPKRRRRGAAVGGGVVAAAVAAFLVVPSLRNQLPAGVPVVGKNADTVWAQIQDSGLAVGEGEPSAPRFRELAQSNACKSSHSFVQTEEDTGWAIICVKPPADAYRSMRESMNGVPALLAPMWVDQNHGEVVIFGMGWPGKASQQIAEAIGGNAEYVSFDGAADSSTP